MEKIMNRSSVYQFLDWIIDEEVGRRCEGNVMSSSLEISQIRCTGLVPTEEKELNPRVSFDFCGVSKSTEQKENVSEADYNEVILFDAFGKTIRPEDELLVRVKDGIDIIGSAQVSIKELSKPDATVSQYSVNLVKGDGATEAGKVKFRVEYRPPVLLEIHEAGEHKNDSVGIDLFSTDKKKTLPNYLTVNGGGSESGESEIDNISSIEADDDGDDEEEIIGDEEQKSSREHNLPDKTTFFQVRIKVKKARNLPGTNIDASVRVTVDNQKRQTKSVKSTLKPDFGETFFFNFNEKPNDLFDKIVKLEVYNTKSKLRSVLLGSFLCDVGLIYFQEQHAVVNKWILLSTLEEHDGSAGLATGFVQITAAVLGPGDELPEKVKDNVEDVDTDDIESNIWMPGGVRLQPATFCIKVYRVEDLHGKSLKNNPTQKKGHKSEPKCDTYCKFMFAGKKGKTRVKRHTYNPEFNEEIRIPFKVPSMCERMKMQLIDWHRAKTNNVIGNNLLSLSDISSFGDSDFLPSFGPCYVNFYGTSSSANWRLSMATQEIGSTDNKTLSGDDYKGRALIEISTKLGNHVKSAKRFLQGQDLLMIKSYLERRKYKLFATFLNASLIPQSEGDIKFEISIGNYGTSFDETVEVLQSTSRSETPVPDGVEYSYVSWGDSKPCCTVESHWEDISFRLGPMNMLRNIAHRLEKNLNVLELAIKLNIKAKAQESEIALLIIRILDHFIEDCNNPLPTFTEKSPGITQLDLKMQDIRKSGLKELIAEATTHRECATDIHAALLVMKGYLAKLKTLCVEPQNSLPDILISMLSGGKRIAYYRMPSEDILFSKQSFCKGMHCGKQQNIVLNFIGKKASDDEAKPYIPAYVKIIAWLGLEEDQDDYINNTALDGKYAMFAETFENQIRVPTIGWTSDGCPRPTFSSCNGEVTLNKDDFVPPQGWVWDKQQSNGEWYVDPVKDDESRERVDSTKEFAIEIFENEVRTAGGKWVHAETPYTSENGFPLEHKDDIKLPGEWTEWTVVENNCDEEGWEYKQQKAEKDWDNKMKPDYMYRRKHLQSKRIFKQEEIKKIENDEEHMEEFGWGYANTFGKKFHKLEKKKDLVRRRRWRRKMVALELGAPTVFSIPNKDKKKPAHCITPDMVLTFNKTHKWQLRAYIFQARNVLAMDDDGLSDPYCIVSFQNQTQKTYTVCKTLCPEWDQTLLFENINMYGSPNAMAENPPHVCINLFDKDFIGKDDYLGRCFVQPIVRLHGQKGPLARLLWHPIMCGTKECGELLATFELFLDEGQDLPYNPPTKENRFMVPNGIRPVIVKTGVEVLCWGVRNLKKHQLANCTSPSVTIQIGNQVIQTDKIKNTKKNPNFIKNTHFFEMFLPKEPIYMHPINIIVRDHRTFGRKPIIGTHVITNLLLDKPPKEDKIRNIVSDEIEDRKLTQSHFSLEVEPEHKEKEKEDEEGDEEEVTLDWWSKYYASIGEETKCGSYLTDGHRQIQIYSCELEKVEDFNGLTDFANTYSLLRGKSNQDDEDGNIAGEFKGAFRLYPLPANPKEKTIKCKYYSDIKYTRPDDYMIRVYVARALDLRPTDANGKSDPYLVVKLGNKRISTRERYIPKELNPFFGEFFEFNAQIPINKDLTIKVKDHDRIGRNDLIGKTVIDLEDRVLSKARATVGLPKTYYTSGPYKWRDIRTPKEILNDVCQVKPKYIDDTRVIVNGKTFDLSDFEAPSVPGPYLGPADQRLALYILNKERFSGMKLVPEHVETRCLYNPLEPNMDQGHIEMFVDIFPLRVAYPLPGPPIDITTRKPKSYELRVIIWNTADVELVDKNIMGEEMSDIYVKAWMEGQKNKKMKTDTHFRSLNGEGNFNWRMIFPFEYIPEENVMVIEKKDHFWSLDKTRNLLPPKMTFQVWDHDFFSRNDFIGTLEVNLNKLPFPKKRQEDCDVDMLEDKSQMFDLFKAKYVKGWWSMAGKSKKTGILEQKGKIEMTLEILSKDDALEKVVGKGRDEPNLYPKLDDPDRPESSFLWYKNFRRTLYFVFWKRYRWFMLGLLIAVLLLLGAFIYLYNILGYEAAKTVGE